MTAREWLAIRQQAVQPLRFLHEGKVIAEIADTGALRLHEWTLTQDVALKMAEWVKEVLE